MSMNESANSGLNPYMKPLDRGSLLSRPAPLAVHRPAQAAAPQPESEEPAFGPKARRVTVFAREEAAQEPPVLQNAVSAPETEPEQISFFTPAPFMATPAEETVSPEENLPEAPVQEETPMEESASFAGYTPNEEPLPAEETSKEEPIQELASPVETTEEDELPPQEEEAPTPESRTAAQDDPSDEEEKPSDEPGFDYDAYYASYWAQWQAAMEAQQNRACAVCPLMGQLQGQNASVCLVPVIVTDAQGQPQEPQAVLRMTGLQSAAPQVPDTAAPAFVPNQTPANPFWEPSFRTSPVPEEAAADEPASSGDFSFGADFAPEHEKYDDDDEYLGEDEMADEDMPVPQTIAPELPDIGPVKKKFSLGWLRFPLIILLALLFLLLVAVIVLSSTGQLQAVVDKLNLPEAIVTQLKNLGLL